MQNSQRQGVQLLARCKFPWGLRLALSRTLALLRRESAAAHCGGTSDHVNWVAEHRLIGLGPPYYAPLLGSPNRPKRL